MTPIERRNKAGIDPEVLAEKLIELVGRVQDLAQEQSQHWTESARVPEWITASLKEAEDTIRELSRDFECLTPHGLEQLREAKEVRREMRAERDAVLKPIRYRAEQWVTLAGESARAVKTLRRNPTDWNRFAQVYRALSPAAAMLTAADRKILRDVERWVISMAVAANSTTAGSSATAATPEPDRGDPRHELPEPADVEFDAAGEGVVARILQRRFDDPAEYALNREAQYLSLVTGFEELLCLPLLRGVEHFPFQINTARQVLRTMRGRALLCDEVGLGKTIEAGLIVKEYVVRSLVRRILILTPPSLVSQWQEQMQDKFEMAFVTHEDSEFRSLGDGAWRKFDRVIASLHTARGKAHADAVHQQSYDMLIVDEAHHLKNRSTVSWKFVNGIKSKYVLLLTATPAQNNLDELFNLITLLSPGQLKTAAAFRREFVEPGDPRRPKNRTKLRELLMDVMVRNSRSQVNVGLPPRRAQTLRVELNPPERALYDAVSEIVRRWLGEGAHLRMAARTLQTEAGSSSEAVAATLLRMGARSAPDGDNAAQSRGAAVDEDLARLRDLATEAARQPGAKLSALISLLRQSRTKSLVFTQYRETQRRVVQALQGAGIEAATFDGGMSAVDKDNQVAAFARDVQVLVSTDVGSEGRNLQFCHTVVNYDLPWNPMRIEQRVGRVHRIGQTEPVIIVNLAARDTVEDYVLELLDKKINMFELVVGEVGEILGNLDDDREFDEIVLDLWARSDSPDAARDAFKALGDQLAAAQASYLQSRDYDNALFGDEFQAEQ
jgi:SNF2 family DNA or RNA helicase